MTALEDFELSLLRVQEPKVVLHAEEADGYAWRPVTDAPTPKLAIKL